MAANISQSEVDCTCPVCCDIFTDPVVLLCGHSFCKRCLQEWWRQSRLHSCPMCKEIFPMSKPPLNLALRNLSDNLRQEKTRRATSKDLCIVHNEKLKLFCQNDEQLICVICRDAQKHKKHNCVPINEAAEQHRTEINVNLMHLKRKLGTHKQEKTKWDKMARCITVQAQQTENIIKEEFQKLYQFLRAEEAARIDAVRKEAKLKSEAMDIRIVNLSAEISWLTDSITAIESELKSEDVSFMLNLKSTMERSEINLSVSAQTPSGALLDEAQHLGNLQFAVWKKMKNLIKYSPLTLDPNTGYLNVIESEGLTRIANNYKTLPLPQNPERLPGSEILGSEGFSSGKHSWDVEVSGYWAVGVAEKNHRRRVWAMYMCYCTNILRERTPEDYVKVICEDLFPQKVRVELDYDQNKVSFIDLDLEQTVHTIHCTFTEPVFPYFRENSKILPLGVSVKIWQPI